MNEYYSIITNTGLAKNAAASLGTKLNLTHIAVGDSNGTAYNPASDATKLKNELHRTATTYVTIDEHNPNQLVIEAIVGEEIGPFYIREVGVFDSDGDLFAIGKFPETFKPNLPSGSGKRLYIRMILGFTSTPQVNLIISDDINHDPNFSTNVNNALADINRTLTNVDVSLSQKLAKAKNLADLENTAEARNNLGLSNGAITNLTGAVMAFAMPIAPIGWLECNGTAVLISSYITLANAIYCGDLNNSTAIWGYKCANQADPAASRSTSGQYIVIPDLRGEFIRGWDNSRGIDPARSLWSRQDDAFQGHWHNLNTVFMIQSGGTTPCMSSNSGSYNDRVRSPVSDGVNGIPRTSFETRPRNIALMYCIKY